MRFLVFSDIHGNAFALEEFLKTISKLTYDYIFFLGDIFVSGCLPIKVPPMYAYVSVINAIKNIKIHW